MLRPKLEELCVREDATIREVMSRLNLVGSGVLLVVDEHGRLQGTLSDGDIRRWLLAGHDLTEKALLVANRDPVTLEAGSSAATARALIDKHQIHLIPVVDQERKVIDFWTRSHHAVRDDTPVVIMAGGLGMRLRPLTDTVPKPMLETGKVPLLERILMQHIQQGAHNFYVSVNYLADVIENHFGDGSRWGVKITYLRETIRLGTGGALSLLGEQDLTSDCVVVVNGDVISEINVPSLIAHHRSNKADATICSRSFSYTVPFGVIHHHDNNITAIEEKPTLEYSINAGIYCLSNDATRMIPKGRYYDITTLFSDLLEQKKRCAILNISGFWLDIGSHDDYARANEHFSI
jgi:dTDP-glucose pyrophosphorylase